MRGLMKAIARGRRDLALGEFEASDISWIVESGLGPSCFHAAQENRANTDSPHWRMLQAADLTARVVAADHAEAVIEILGTAAGRVPRMTLLKGISLADKVYPEFHLRPMRDVDLLVDRDSVASMESVLRELGYEQRSASDAAFYDHHHHTMPFFHAEKNVWVEVHHGLMAPRSRASRDALFAPASVQREMRASSFQGKTVCRLSAELELVYLAAHWAQDFKSVGGMVALIDLIHLLRAALPRLCWEKILSWLERSASAHYLYLALSYLARRGWIDLPADLLLRLGRARLGRGEFSIHAAHALIDRYLLDGESFSRWLSQRNLAIAWKTLILPAPELCKLMLIPFNLCTPEGLRFD